MLAVTVAVERTVYHFDEAFSYAVPPDLEAQAQPGCRVLVPFGKGNATRQGMILSRTEAPEASKLKVLQAVLDPAPLLSNEALFAVPWMKAHYFCTLYEAVKLFLPVGITYQMRTFYTLSAPVSAQTFAAHSAEEQAVLTFLKAHPGTEHRALCKALSLPPESTVLQTLCRQGLLTRSVDPVRRMQDATMQMVRLLPQADAPKLTRRQQDVYRVLLDVGCASVKELCYFTGVTPAVVKNLCAHGVCELYEQEVYRSPFREAPESEQAPLSLSGEQVQAFETLSALYHAPRAATALLYGVTGSGKTSVYLRLIDQAQEEGRGVLFLVPEISLTPQMVARFRARYGERVALFHSGLSMGERMDEWKRVHRGEAKIVVGTRSAVFAPLEDIGLIILDEEQESSYKSEQSPRYSAREVAGFRSRYHKALLLFGSATPRLETYYAAQQGKIGFAKLLHRYGDAKLPKVEICDRNEEYRAGNFSILSDALYRALLENLQAGHQSILLLNRRGYQTFVSCRDCGHVMTCPNCSISLTYHAANGRLLCHYCGYSIPFTAECPSCHGHHMHYAGMGTQKAEEELAESLPQARILRLDTDATMRRFAFEEKLAQFAKGAYDILVGTQMVAKGLDFENVTLVGVLNADASLYCEDFRSSEETFDLLTQVVGRAGRGRFEGRAFIQTQTPENPIFSLAARQAYPAFYETELAQRKLMLYPPFSDLCVVGFVGANLDEVRAAAQRFFGKMTALAKEAYPTLPLRILRPCAARIPRAGGKYRFQILIKCRNGTRFREMMRQLLISFGRDRQNRAVTAFADINPDTVW